MERVGVTSSEQVLLDTNRSIIPAFAHFENTLVNAWQSERV